MSLMKSIFPVDNKGLGSMNLMPQPAATLASSVHPTEDRQSSNMTMVSQSRSIFKSDFIYDS